jgi:endonuclease YncB( thermonuclease family)
VSGSHAGGVTHLCDSAARAVFVVAVATVALWLAASASSTTSASYRIDHVTDGDTVVLRNGQRVRLVQIDTPEVYFGTECYGRQASALLKRLLPEGTVVQLQAEPATDRKDKFGRLLRYVVQIDQGNINVRMVALGAAAPYFYMGRRGRYASQLEFLAKQARAEKRGLWGACPHTLYDPYHGIETRR